MLMIGPAAQRKNALASWELDRCGLARGQLVRKTICDMLLTVPLILVAMIPMLLVAVAIKLDSHGPVFFRQPRVGLNGRIFRMWKFRTMHVCDADMDGVRLTRRCDPRITRVGARLRKWSIDEVPQLLNVLTGDMSLVGPRPHAVKANVGNRLYSELIPNYWRRHCVKPGITGWAQVNGWRGETTTFRQIEQRVLHDLEYISRQSLPFDFWILALTLSKIFDERAF